VSFYGSLGGSRRGSGSRSSAAAAQRQLTAAAKAEQAQGLATAIQAVLNLHRAEFPPAQPPVAPPAVPIEEKAIHRRHERQALAGIGMFRRAERAQARTEARQRADMEIAAARSAAEAERERLQSDLDRRWALLSSNDPEVVLETLEEAFADNDAPAAAVGVADDAVSVVVLVPDADDLPERLPTTTAAGNLSLRKLTKAERADLYSLMVFGHVLATVRETFAVAPGAQSLRAVALRRSRPDAYGRPRVDCVLATRIPRTALEGVQWDTAEADTVITSVAEELVMVRRRQSEELQPINLAREPELAALLQVVDLGQLVGEADGDQTREITE
jgi:hypothetical protein